MGRAKEPKEKHPGTPKPCKLPGKTFFFSFSFFRPAKFISSDFGGAPRCVAMLVSYALNCVGAILLGCLRAPPRLTCVWGLGYFGSLASIQQILVSVDIHWGESISSFHPKCLSQLHGLTHVNPSILGALKEKVNLDTIC